jgi:integrase/recombinase XerD
MVFYMHEILSKMQVAMELKGFAQSTKKTYLGHIRRFSEFCNKPLDKTDYEDIRSFLFDAISNRKLSGVFVDSNYAAIKFMYCFVLGKKWDMQEVPRLKRKFFLPHILSKDEVIALIDSTINLKHKAALATAYSAGLRVSEITHLKVSDIDSTNMRIFVRQAKGGRDRFTILSDKNLSILRQYFKAYRPVGWLFPGVPASNPISERTLQKTFKEAALRVGIKKNVSIHSLRHCFATHMLNSGASILTIKDLLGHSNIETTCKYLHLTHSQVLGVKSPFDDGGDFNA